MLVSLFCDLLFLKFFEKFMFNRPLILLKPLIYFDLHYLKYYIFTDLGVEVKMFLWLLQRQIERFRGRFSLWNDTFCISRLRKTISERFYHLSCSGNTQSERRSFQSKLFRQVNEVTFLNLFNSLPVEKKRILKNYVHVNEEMKQKKSFRIIPCHSKQYKSLKASDQVAYEILNVKVVVTLKK